jgi:hypothetical protein
MDNIYCRDLKVNFDIDQSIFQKVDSLDGVQVNNFKYYKLSAIEYPASIIKWLDQYGIFVAWIDAICMPPHSTIPIHIDGQRLNSSRCKLNWVYCQGETKTEWWTINQLQDTSATSVLDNTANYLRFDPAECTQVWSAQLGQPSLIEAGLPHSVINSSEYPRWCLSNSLCWKSSRHNVRFQEAVEVFKDYIVN